MGGEINANFKDPMFYIDAARDCNGQPTRDLTPDVAGHRQAWRDFRAYGAARDNGTNLTSYGTADGDTGIGFSSGNSAANSADAGTVFANSAASPALAKLHDHLHGGTMPGALGSAHS